MMRTLQITLVLMLLTISVNISKAKSASGWIDSGAVWHHGYSFFMFGSPQGYFMNQYVGDTTIAGRVFQKLNTIRQTATFLPNSLPVISDTIAVGTYLYHTSNDTVYGWRNNSLCFLWSLNPDQGDVWDFGLVQDNSTGNIKKAYALVDSVYTEVINGVVTKNILIESCKDSLGSPFNWGTSNDTALLINYGKINSKFGPMTGFNSVYEHPFCSNYFVDEYISDNFLCFESSTFPFYKPDNIDDCTNNIFTIVAELDNNNEVVFAPNPASNQLNIQFEKSIEILKRVVIHDALGREVMNISTNNQQNVSLDISELNVGLYFIKIKLKGGKSFTEKLQVMR